MDLTESIDDSNLNDKKVAQTHSAEVDCKSQFPSQSEPLDLTKKATPMFNVQPQLESAIPLADENVPEMSDQITIWFQEEPLNLTKKGTLLDKQPQIESIIPHDKRLQYEPEISHDDEDDSEKSFDENDDPNVVLENVNTKRSIKWINSGKTYIIPQNIWNEVYVKGSNNINKELFTYWKNKIGSDFDKTWECILLLRSPRVGKNIVTIQGYCKHKKCRKFKFVTPTLGMRNGESPKFTVCFSSITVHHEKAIVRQCRAVLRDEAKKELQFTLPATYTRRLVDELDEELYTVHKKSTVLSDATTEKMRSEYLRSQDCAKSDFDDMVALQKQTKDSPYIQKVISPYAIYMHSKEQYDTLILYHKRKPPGTETVGRLDATGNVVHVTPETSDHPVMYYPLVITIKMDDTDPHSTLFPITESLNSGHGVPDMGGWLHDFNENFIAYNSQINPILDRIVSDFSYANFHAVLHTFQSMRLQQYLFVCYKYAVNLEDFSILMKLVKLIMCATHLSKTKAAFVRGYFPCESNKNTMEHYVTEILMSLITCKSYNLIKEIFRNLCIILCSEYKTKKFKIAKECIVKLTEKELLIKTRDQFRCNFKYNVIVQEKLDEMSEDESIYDLNESILKLPIYKGSPFYQDLKFIFDAIMSEIAEGDDEEDELEELEKNSLFKVELLEHFLKQFGGILPLWTGITLPESVERYDNQPAERQMRVAKDLLDEMALKIGYHKVRPTRFVKLLRGVTVSHAKRYKLKIARRGCSSGIRVERSGKQKVKRLQIKAVVPSRVRSSGYTQKNKPKDDSKVIKKIIKHIRTVASKKVSAKKKIYTKSPNDSLENANCSNYSLQSSNHSLEDSYQSSEISKVSLQNSLESISESETVGGAKEGWSKTSKRRSSYHNRKTILSSLLNKVKSSKDIAKSTPKTTQKKNGKSRKASPLAVNPKRNRTASPLKVSTPALAKNKNSTFSNGLLRNINYYQQLLPCTFNVGKIDDCKLMNNDYRSLKPGSDLSLNTMDYILKFTLQGRYINLLRFADHILEEKPVRLPYNITKSVCFMPLHTNNTNWECYIIDCKNSTFCHFHSNDSNHRISKINFEKKMEKFISFYNDDNNHHSKLQPIEFWKEIPAIRNNVVQSVDSGVFVVHCLYYFVSDGQLHFDNFDPTTLRQQLLIEVLKYSDDILNVCVLCGDENDSSTSNLIDWSNCVSCDRWYHNSCIRESRSDVDYICELCNEHLAGLSSP